MKNSTTTLLGLGIVFLSTILGWQSESNDNSVNSAEGREASSLLQQASWIAGHWRGTGMDGTFEETWNPPLAGSIMGMFKFIKDEKVVFYEFLTILEKDDSLVLRLKHFDGELKGWEAKDEFVEFPLISVSDDSITFEGLVFRRTNESEMKITVRTQQGKETQEIEFHCRRVAEAK